MGMGKKDDTHLTGPWKGTEKLLAGLSNPRSWAEAKDRALLKEAHRLRGLMVESFNQRGPKGGPRWKPLSTFTQLVSRARGKGDRRPLLDSGDLRNSHSVVRKGEEVFVGVHRSARGKRGANRSEPLVNIAKVQEYGAGPILIPVTAKMRRFFFWLSAQTKGQVRPLKKTTTTIVVRIPPRPWIGPIWEQEKDNIPKNVAQQTYKSVFASLLPLLKGD